MTPTQRVALWERVNAYAETCGADTSDGSVGADRQLAVVALESEIEAFERKASAPSWLGDAAEALGEVRPEDGAPLALNWTQVIAAVHELREDRDHWKLRAERAEYTQSQDLEKKLAAIATLVSIYDNQDEPEGQVSSRRALTSIGETIGQQCSICRSRHGSEVRHACE